MVQNGLKYTIMKKAITNTLQLECRSMGNEEEKICKMFYKGRENLTHFLIKSESLQEYRREILELQRPNEESMEDAINKILLFAEVALGEEAKYACFLHKL